MVLEGILGEEGRADFLEKLFLNSLISLFKIYKTYSDGLNSLFSFKTSE